MAALPLNTAPHFVFYYRFCNSLDFYCSLNPKELFLSFSRTFCDYQGEFFKIQGQFKEKLHFFRIPGVFKDQAGRAQLSRDIQNEPCYTSITLFCLKEIEFK